MDFIRDCEVSLCYYLYVCVYMHWQTIFIAFLRTVHNIMSIESFMDYFNWNVIFRYVSFTQETKVSDIFLHSP